MADRKQWQRREAPAALADALGSHAAAAGSQRQQALARAASLLRMKPKVTSARGGEVQRWPAGPAGAAAPAPTAAPSAALQPPLSRRHAPEAPKVQQSVHGGSSHVQPQQERAPAGSGAVPAAEPAASTRSSAGAAEPAPGGQATGQAPAAAAAQQQWAGVREPDTYFSQARSYLQRLAAVRNGVGVVELAAAPELLLQKLEGRAERLPGPSGSTQQQQQQQRQRQRQQQQEDHNQRPAPAAANTQRPSARSYSGAAVLSNKQQQQQSQVEWRPHSSAQRHSSKAGRRSGSMTRSPPSSLQPRAGSVALSGDTLLPAGMLGGSNGGGSRGATFQWQQDRASPASSSSWGLEGEDDEEAGADALGGFPQCLQHSQPAEQQLGGSGAAIRTAFLQPPGEAAAARRLLEAEPSSSAGGTAGWVARGTAAASAGAAVGQLGAAGGDTLDGLFQSTKRRRAGELHMGSAERSWWDGEPGEALATWGSPGGDAHAAQQHGGNWQQQDQEQQGAWRLLDDLASAEPAMPQLCQPERMQQPMAPLLGARLGEERLPAFLAPSPGREQRQRQTSGWEEDEIEDGAFGWDREAPGSGSSFSF